MDETSIRIKGQWRYLYRLPSTRKARPILLTAHRAKETACAFSKKWLGSTACRRMARDKSGSNLAALKPLQEETGKNLYIRQIK